MRPGRGGDLKYCVVRLLVGKIPAVEDELWSVAGKHKTENQVRELMQEWDDVKARGEEGGQVARVRPDDEGGREHQRRASWRRAGIPGQRALRGAGAKTTAWGTRRIPTGTKTPRRRTRVTCGPSRASSQTTTAARTLLAVRASLVAARHPRRRTSRAGGACSAA